MTRSQSVRLLGAFLLAQFFVFLGSNPAAVLAAWQDYLADTASVFMLTWLIWNWLDDRIRRLDAQLPWTEAWGRRLWAQAGQGVALPALFCIGWMMIYLRFRYGVGLHETTFWQYELPIALVVFVLLNALYTGYFFYRKNRQGEAELGRLRDEIFSRQNAPEPGAAPVAYAGPPTLPAEVMPARPRTFLAVSGKRHIPLPVSELAALFKQGELTVLQTFDTEEYLFTDSLDELMALLDPAEFFRANRQCIVNRRACLYFTTEDNGKLALHLLPGLPVAVVISQKKAAEFRQWLNG